MHLRSIARGLTLAVVIIGVATGVSGSRGPAARPRTEDCPAAPGAVVPAASLTEPVPVTDCDLRGALVSAGELVAQVPRIEGEYLTMSAEARRGNPAVLTVWYTGGAVGARLLAEGEHPAPSPVQRLGSANDATTPSPSASATAGPATATSRRCTDSAGTWLGMRWTQPYRWWFNARSIPDYLTTADQAVADVGDVVRSAAHNVDSGRNECGLSDNLGLSQRYLGETRREAGVRADGTCGAQDHRNIVSFGDLSPGLLALTCVWWLHDNGDGRTVEADVRINAMPGLFSLQPSADCGTRWDLEGTLTHEFGHVFGLGHVPYAQHGEQTMSDGLPPCSTHFRGLGLGDYLTLRQHYGGH